MSENKEIIRRLLLLYLIKRRLTKTGRTPTGSSGFQNSAETLNRRVPARKVPPPPPPRRRLTKARKKPRWWVRPAWTKRDTEGHYHTLMNVLRKTDIQGFQNFTRMSTVRYDRLLALVEKDLTKNPQGRKALPPGHRLAVTLRYLATGDNFPSIANGFRIGVTTGRRVILETCRALWSVLQPLYLPLPTTKHLRTVADDYSRLWQFPNCCGAMDSKRVVMQQPVHSDSVSQNSKGTDSFLLLAVVDAKYRFLCVDVGGSDPASDGGILQSSTIGKALQEGTLYLPPPCPLPKSNVMMPHVFLGDGSFQLQDDFICPYPGQFLEAHKQIFNYRLSRARRCSENAFGILASRWRVFRRPLSLNPENAKLVTMAAIALHNYLLMEELKDDHAAYNPPGFADFTDGNGIVQNGQWRAVAEPTLGLLPLPSCTAQNWTIAPQNAQDALAEYFCSVPGELPGQWKIPEAYGGDPEVADSE